MNAELNQVHDATAITVRTRTGKQTHAGHSNSSVTYCGRWLRVNGSAYKIADGYDAVTCEACKLTLEANRRIHAALSDQKENDMHATELDQIAAHLGISVSDAARVRDQINEDDALDWSEATRSEWSDACREAATVLGIV